MKLPRVSWEAVGWASRAAKANPPHGQAEDWEPRMGGRRPQHPLEMQIKISGSCKLAVYPPKPLLRAASLCSSGWNVGLTGICLRIDGNVESNTENT